LEEGGILALSTFCVDQLEEEQRWELLRKHVNPIFGRTELPKQKFIKEGLTPIPDWQPDRHVNIVGWPAAEEECKSIAQALYDEQRFIPIPD
jgi:hypothetical protein